MKMNWTKLKQIVLDHPYFDINGTALTSAEADMLLKSSTNDASAFMKRVLNDLEANSDPLRLSLYTERIAAQFANRVYALQVKRKMRPIIRRVGIVATVILVLLGFSLFTNKGKALASSIYQTVIEIIDGVFQSQQQGSTISEIDFSELPLSFDNVDDAESWLGLPIAYIQAEKAELESINVISVEDASLLIRSKYSYSNDASILVEQKYRTVSESSGTATSIEDGTFGEFETTEGTEYYIGAMEDGTAFARTFTDNSEIFISSFEMSQNTLVELLKFITIS